MAKIDPLVADMPSWSPSAEGTPLQGLLPIALIAVLAGSFLLGWSAYQGQALILLSMIVAAGLLPFLLLRPELAILVLISTMLLTYPDILQGEGPLTINNLLGGMLLLIIASRIFNNRDLWFLQEREVKLLLLLGLLFLISTVVTQYTLPKLRYAVFHEERAIRDFTLPWLQIFCLRGIAFVLFFVNFITTRRHVIYVLLLFLACVLVTVPPSIQVYMMSGADGDFRISAARSSFFMGGGDWIRNANRYAFMCLLSTSLLFYFFTVTQRWGVKLLIIPGIVSLTVLTLLAGSRSGFLGLLLLGGWLYTQGKGMGREMRVGAVLFGVSAILAFFLLAPAGVQERLVNINPFNPVGEGASSTQMRTATLAQSFDIFVQHPFFGVGLGNFRWMNTHLHGNHKPPHNSYLWALAEGGALCLLLYFFLFSSLFKRIRAIRQQFRADPVLPHIGEWLLFYLILFLFFSFFADVWLTDIHLYLMIGLSIVLQRLAPEQASDG